MPSGRTRSDEIRERHLTPSSWLQHHHIGPIGRLRAETTSKPESEADARRRSGASLTPGNSAPVLTPSMRIALADLK